MLRSLWRAREKAIEARQRPRSSASATEVSAARSASIGACSGVTSPARYPARSDSRYDMLPPTCRPGRARTKCPFHRIGRV